MHEASPGLSARPISDIPAGMFVRDPKGDEPAIVELTRRLQEFYSSATDYDAFNHPPDYSEVHNNLRPLLEERLAANSDARVLELGAGRSALGQWVRSNFDRVTYTAQDITNSNEAHLREQTDDVRIGDISVLETGYDLIVSMYVLEHVSTPSVWLGHIDRLLAPGGWHVVVCPRYDMPLYLCPSLRHLAAARKAMVEIGLDATRLGRLIDGRPRFLVNPQPAVLSKTWYRDADAVHLVSQRDLDRWHAQRGYLRRKLPLPTRSWKQWIVRRLLTVSCGWQKPSA